MRSDDQWGEWCSGEELIVLCHHFSSLFFLFLLSLRHFSLLSSPLLSYHLTSHHLSSPHPSSPLLTLHHLSYLVTLPLITSPPLLPSLTFTIHHLSSLVTSPLIPSPLLTLHHLSSLLPLLTLNHLTSPFLTSLLFSYFRFDCLPLCVRSVHISKTDSTRLNCTLTLITYVLGRVGRVTPR